MVLQLQKELHERDNVISQLHEQMSVASFQTSPIHSPYVMSPGTRSPGDRSPDADKTPPLGCRHVHTIRLCGDKNSNVLKDN